MTEPLILVCIEGAYSNGMTDEDGFYQLTQNLDEAARWTKTQLDLVFQHNVDMPNLFDAVPLSQVKAKELVG